MDQRYLSKQADSLRISAADKRKMAVQLRQSAEAKREDGDESIALAHEAQAEKLEKQAVREESQAADSDRAAQDMAMRLDMIEQDKKAATDEYNRKITYLERQRKNITGDTGLPF